MPNSNTNNSTDNTDNNTGNEVQTMQENIYNYVAAALKLQASTFEEFTGEETFSVQSRKNTPYIRVIHGEDEFYLTVTDERVDNIEPSSESSAEDLEAAWRRGIMGMVYNYAVAWRQTNREQLAAVMSSFSKKEISSLLEEMVEMGLLLRS